MKTIDKKEFGISELLCALYACNNILIVTINQIFNEYIMHTSIDTIMCIAVLMLIGIASLEYIFTNIHIEDMAFIGAFIIISCLSYILFPATQKYMNTYAGKIFMNTLLPYVLAKGITDTEKFDKCFDRISVASIISAVLLMMMKNASGILQAEEMNIAYSFILPSVYLLYRWLENKKEIWRLILFLASVVLLFLSGARGPFLCIVVFAIMYLLLNNRKVSTIVFALTALVTAFALYYSGIIRSWLERLQVVLVKNELPTRIVDMFLLENITWDSSRSMIYERVMSAIRMSPLYGNGIMGDRVATEGLYRYESGTYAHNAFLELMCHFGIVAGILLVLFAVWIFVKGYACAKTRNEKGMLTVLISVSVTQLVVSYSYLFSLRLFLAIGYAVVLIQKEKYSKKVKL